MNDMQMKQNYFQMFELTFKVISTLIFSGGMAMT